MAGTTLTGTKADFYISQTVSNSGIITTDAYSSTANLLVGGDYANSRNSALNRAWFEFPTAVYGPLKLRNVLFWFWTNSYARSTGKITVGTFGLGLGTSGTAITGTDGG